MANYLSFKNERPGRPLVCFAPAGVPADRPLLFDKGTIAGVSQKGQGYQCKASREREEDTIDRLLAEMSKKYPHPVHSTRWSDPPCLSEPRPSGSGSFSARTLAARTIRPSAAKMVDRSLGAIHDRQRNAVEEFGRRRERS